MGYHGDKKHCRNFETHFLTKNELHQESVKTTGKLLPKKQYVMATLVTAYRHKMTVPKAIIHENCALHGDLETTRVKTHFA